jgi:hypothetical protein
MYSRTDAGLAVHSARLGDRGGQLQASFLPLPVVFPRFSYGSRS